jgi:aspartate kinase
MIVKETPQMEGIAVSGATIQKDMAKISLVGVDNRPGNAAKIFRCLAGAKVIVNDIMQTEVSADKANLAFTIASADLRSARDAMESLKGEVKYDGIFIREDIAEVSAVGVGMRSHYGIAEKMFSSLAKAQVNIDSITTSEIRISCVIDKDQAERALAAVCDAFELDKPAEKRKH